MYVPVPGEVPTKLEQTPIFSACLATQLLQVQLHVFIPNFLTLVELELLALVLDRLAWLGCGLELSAGMPMRFPTVSYVHFCTFAQERGLHG